MDHRLFIIDYSLLTIDQPQSVSLLTGFKGYFKPAAEVRFIVKLPTTSSTCAFTGMRLLSSVIQRYSLLSFLKIRPGIMVGLNFRHLKVPIEQDTFSLPI